MHTIRDLTKPQMTVQDNVQSTNSNPALFTIREERDSDFMAREALLDAEMGVQRKRKSSEKLRKNRLPAEGLALVAQDAQGDIIGTIRLWHVAVKRNGNKKYPALLLGPLAVAARCGGQGVGSALMRAAINQARCLGHGAIFLVGDPGYYQRFGFSNAHTEKLFMPGPYEPHRFQALELQPDYLAGTYGVLAPAGQKKIMRQFAKTAHF